jgi:hypothetical protein
LPQQIYRDDGIIRCEIEGAPDFSPSARDKDEPSCDPPIDDHELVAGRAD